MSFVILCYLISPWFDILQVTVRFRDSRIAFGASRYCNASVTNSFMETLTPLNQVILYGTLMQPPAVESHVCAVQPHSEAGATTRKRARPAAVEREGRAMVGEVETERKGAPPKKRKDPYRSNDPPTADRHGIGQASATASIEAREVTSTGNSTSSPRQSTGGVTIQPLETISQLRRSYFSPHANLLRPPITGGQAKSRQIQRHNWEQALAGVDSADLEVASTFDMWQWLALRHTWRCIAPGCSHCASVANHATDADVLALRDIGCHVGHVKYFRPLEMQPEDASSGAHRRRANSGLSSGYCSSSVRSRSSSFSFTDRGVPSESSQELERSLALFEPAAAVALSHRSHFCALNGDVARPEQTPCTPLTPLEEHLLQLVRCCVVNCYYCYY